MTEINVRVLGPGDPTPTPETYGDELKQVGNCASFWATKSLRWNKVYVYSKKP